MKNRQRTVAMKVGAMVSVLVLTAAFAAAGAKVRTPAAKSNSVGSQIVLDPTEKATIVRQGKVYQINPSRPDVNRANLFFNFQRFDVAAGEEVSFAPLYPQGVAQRVFALIRDSRASWINGKLRTPRDVSLVLVNPRGVTFGSKARLELRAGSLSVLAADKIKFADQTVDLNVGPAATPDMGEPLEISFGGTGGNIVVGGAILRLSPNDPSTATEQPSVTLSGAQVAVKRGGQVESRGGQIVLAAVKEGMLTRDDAGKPLVIGARGNVNVIDGAIIETSDFTQDGPGKPGEVNVIGDAVAVSGATADGMRRSSIQASSVGGARGTEGGRIVIDASGQVRVSGGATLMAASAGSKKGAPPAGKISIHGDSIVLDGGGKNKFPGVLAFTSRGGPGEVKLTATGAIVIRRGAVVNVSGDRQSPGGVIYVNAGGSLLIDGADAVSRDTGLFARGQNTSDSRGGAIVIDADNVTLVNEGRISASGTGGGGTVQVRARNDVVIDGGSRDAQNDETAIFAKGREGSSGGLIGIEFGRSLRLAQKGQISAQSDANAAAGGSVDIHDGQDVGIVNLSTGTISAAGKEGAGGSISTSANVVVIRNGSRVVVAPDSPITISGEQLFISPDTEFTGRLELKGEASGAEDVMVFLLPWQKVPTSTSGAPGQLGTNLRVPKEFVSD